ncbi:MAG: MarR family transcriptional regulator [Candidatus Dormibacteraeota bacterium]|nr:MarR family transcriptional regulator [Candidatus Dormibacteraeota bacterium]
MMVEDEPGAEFPGTQAAAAVALKRLVSALSADLMEVFSRLNVTLPQLRVVHIIRKEGRVSGRQLARELKVSPGAVVQLCDRLQEQGYVERVPDTDDRRVTWFQLTEMARALFEELLAIRRSRLAPALARLSERDTESLTRILGEMADVLESERRKDPNPGGSLLDVAAIPGDRR